jgi:hypothetical protein
MAHNLETSCRPIAIAYRVQNESFENISRFKQFFHFRSATSGRGSKKHAQRCYGNLSWRTKNEWIGLTKAAGCSDALDQCFSRCGPRTTGGLLGGPR